MRRISRAFTLPLGALRREILLNPDPVTLSERVRMALMPPDQCHREQEFAELVLSIRARLERVYDETPDGHDAVVVSGSGTCAVEAMVASLVPREGTALVVTSLLNDRRARPREERDKI